MEPLIVLLAIYLLVVLVILPIWCIVKILAHNDDIDLLQNRLRGQEEEIRSLLAALGSLQAVSLTRKGPKAEPQVPAPKADAPTVATAPAPMPVPEVPVVTSAPIPEVHRTPAATAPSVEAPPLLTPQPPKPPAAPPTPPKPAAPPPERPAINWEQFMGAKLFAWLGGLALFLGVAFFVKFSFEHDLIPPQVRVALGFLAGVGLIVGGLKTPAQRYRITSQTLMAAGVVSLYAVTFACDSIYHFAFFGPVPTFLLMALITASAFILAVRLDAQVVAVLGILGGFLTPILIHTGHDNPVGLFSYIALLVVGLVAVALHRGWVYLVPLGAAGTVIMMAAWANTFFAPEKTGVAMAVCIGFSVLFMAASEWARRRGHRSQLLSGSALALPAAAFCFAFFFMEYPPVASRTGLLFTFVGLCALAAAIQAWREEQGEILAFAAALCGALTVRWVAGYFVPEQAPVVAAVCTGFSALFFAAYLAARRLGLASGAVLASAAALPALGLLFAGYLAGFPSVAAQPALLLGLIFACDGFLLALAWLDARVHRLHFASGLAVFALLSYWACEHLGPPLLPWALGANLLFAGLHTAAPLLLERRRPASSPTWWSQLFPPLALLLMLLPIFKIDAGSLLVWPAVLLVDVLAIAAALVSASLTAVAAVLALTLLATGLSVFRTPAELVLEPSLLVVIGAFSVFFFFAGLWLVRRLGDRLPVAKDRVDDLLGDARGQIPALASLLPFLLLIMVCAHLSVPDPSSVFGMGLLLVVLTLGLARIMAIEWLPACALAGMAALEFAWHSRHFSAATPALPLFWYIALYAVFAAYPFLFRKAFARMTGPWAVGALSGPAHFWVTYQAVRLGWPNGMLGLVPAAFALAPLASLAAVLRSTEETPARLGQRAWFGGVALFFITLVFPVQFERQWITVAWALEGAALLWLFHRVPHPGLRVTGTALLVVAFGRLGLNHWVLSYHIRGSAALLNWYLYAYGIVIAALFAGARLLAPPRERVLGIEAPRVLYALGVLLSFLLLNIEIADYFTPPGSQTLTFVFSGNFARDMCYTIGWALFSLALLTAGMRTRQRGLRYAAMALLGAALLKLFFHDLARLEALYRIAALFAVAVVAMVASFAYQRFLPNDEPPPTPQP